MDMPEVFAIPHSKEGHCCFCGQPYQQEHVVVVLFADSHPQGEVCPRCLAVRYPATFSKALRAARSVVEVQDPSATHEDLDAFDKRHFRECFGADPRPTVLTGIAESRLATKASVSSTTQSADTGGPMAARRSRFQPSAEFAKQPVE